MLMQLKSVDHQPAYRSLDVGGGVGRVAVHGTFMQDIRFPL